MFHILVSLTKVGIKFMETVLIDVDKVTKAIIKLNVIYSKKAVLFHCFILFIELDPYYRKVHQFHTITATETQLRAN
jgi:hypothetical protein